MEGAQALGKQLNEILNNKTTIDIFSNLQAISESGDRILVLYGGEHLKILRDFLKDNNDCELIEALGYLS